MGWMGRSALLSLVEFAAGNGLFGADTASDDVGFEIVFAQNGGAGQAAQHCNLSDVTERVGDGALEEAFEGPVEGLGRRQVVVEFLYRSEKPLDFGVPAQGCGVVPSLLAVRDRERPVKQVAHVHKDLHGRARLVADMERAEMVRRAAQGFAAAISNSSQGVAQ